VKLQGLDRKPKQWVVVLCGKNCTAGEQSFSLKSNVKLTPNLGLLRVIKGLGLVWFSVSAV